MIITGPNGRAEAEICSVEFAAKIEFRGTSFAYTYTAKTLFECEIYIDSFRLPVQILERRNARGGVQKSSSASFLAVMTSP